MNKYVEAVKAVRAAAAECIKEARKGNACYYRHRDVELIPCRSDSERCNHADADYILLKELSGKAIEEAVTRFKANHPDYHHVDICGGVDCYESLAVFFESRGDDYDPYTDSWDIEDTIT